MSIWNGIDIYRPSYHLGCLAALRVGTPEQFELAKNAYQLARGSVPQTGSDLVDYLKTGSDLVDYLTGFKVFVATHADRFCSSPDSVFGQPVVYVAKDLPKTILVPHKKNNGSVNRSYDLTPVSSGSLTWSLVSSVILPVSLAVLWDKTKHVFSLSNAKKAWESRFDMPSAHVSPSLHPSKNKDSVVPVILFLLSAAAVVRGSTTALPASFSLFIKQ